MSLLSPPDEPDEVDFIAYETAQVNPNDDVRMVAEGVFNEALSNADYGGAGDRTIYGNPTGRSLLEEVQDTKERMKRLEDMVTTLQTDANKQRTDANKQRTDIADLQHRVNTLTYASEGYKKIRYRFLYKYQKDFLGGTSREGHRIINEGNRAAHEGDAIADAELYNSRDREDEDVLFHIYGLTAVQISNLVMDGQNRIIATLNAGATWKARGNVPTDVSTTFEAFVKEIPTSHGKDVTDGTNSLSRAYYAFWDAHNRNSH